MVNYRRACIEDESNIMELMNTAFSERVPHDFKVVSPKLYLYPGYSKCHVVAEEDGELIATIAVLPLKLHPTPESELCLGYIGNVCSRKDKRKEGHIRKLMQMVLEDGKSKYDVMVLGGQRQLYGGFGFEPGAIINDVRITQTNVKYGLKNVDAAGVNFIEQVKENTEHLDEIVEIMKAQTFMCERNADNVIDIAHSWKTKLYGAFSAEGELLAYICAHPGGVIELGTRFDAEINRVLKAWVEQFGNTNLLMPLSDIKLFSVVSEWAESWGVYNTEKMLVNNWQKTLNVLFSESVKGRETENGSMTVEITGVGRFRLTADGGRASVTETNEPADVVVDERQAISMFFSSAGYIHSANKLARAWLPLPFAIRSVDQF